MKPVEWTVEQATDLLLELVLTLLDGCDDEDVVRPGMVLEALRMAWSPASEIPWPEMTAGELRQSSREARARLAHGEHIP